ncbi:MAG: STAS domain-containing protein [Firmicutes bacterium]|nr:STAS domain-containing protein [Bacillota bacterium]
MDFVINSNLNEQNNCWDVDVTGEIDIFNSAEFKTTLLKLLDEKPLDLSIDCKKLTYIDSTGLGALVAVLKKTKEFEKNVILKNVKPNSAKLFKITSLDKVFKIEGELNE